MSRPKLEPAWRDLGPRGATPVAGPPSAVVSSAASSTLSRALAGPEGEGRRPRSRRGWATQAPLALVALPAVVLLVPLVTHRGPFSNWGDGAATELAVQNAAHLHQTVGPYDRFGWNHPGPAVFYLLAIPYTLLGGSGVALPAGAVLINLGAGLGIVALVGRRAGSRAALGAAALATVFESLLGVTNLTNVWNPVLIVLPTALFLVLCADLAAGNVWALVGAVGLGSFLVQTHIGTLAPVGVALLLAVSVRAVVWVRTGGPRPWRRPVLVAGSAGTIGALLWAPPVWQQLTARPGNLGTIATFFIHGRGHHSVHEAVSALANGMLAADLGRHLGSNVGASHRHDVALGVLAACVVAVAGICWYRRQWFALALAAGVLPVALVFFVSLLRVQDAIVGYLVLWTSSLTFCAVLGLVVGLTGARSDPAGKRDWPAPIHRAGGMLLLAGALAASVHLSVEGLPLHPGGGYQTVTDASAAVERLLPRETDRVLVCIATADAWPSAGGVIANLRRDGVDARVGPQWLHILGHHLAPSGREDVAVFLAAATDPQPRLPVAPVTAGAGGDLTVRVYRPAQGPVPATLCPHVP